MPLVMNLADCYRLLGLRVGAPFEDIKAAYRRLARQYHPDVNPGDRLAEERFIRVTQAYQVLLDQVEPAPQASSPECQGAQSMWSGDLSQPGGNPTAMDQMLKQRIYDQLQQCLGNRRFPRAIALVEGLAQRLPQDLEVRQWQAIAYQSWGRQLIQESQFDKARVYFKKAMRVVPHNQMLQTELERDLERVEQLLQSF